MIPPAVPPDRAPDIAPGIHPGFATENPPGNCLRNHPECYLSIPPGVPLEEIHSESERHLICRL